MSNGQAEAVVAFLAGIWTWLLIIFIATSRGNRD
jgi:hypothetical protein